MKAQITRPPVSRWQLLQVGPARVPVLDAQTTLAYNAATAVSQLASGASLDHFAGRRAPWKQPTFEHAGLYECCPDVSGCGGCGGCDGVFEDELDAILSTKGTYVPFLFCRDYTCAPACKDTCYAQPTCITYAWAYGKVEEVIGPFKVSDYASPEVNEAAIKGVLAGPLRLITWPRWRYGRTIDTVQIPRLVVNGDVVQELIVPRRLLQMDAETYAAEPLDEWWVPCDRPQRCSPERFWPRDLNGQFQNGDGLLHPHTNWDAAQVIRARAPTQQLLQISGSAPPRVQCLATGDAQFTVKNPLGTFTYDFPSTPPFRIYTDTDTGRVLQFGYGDVATLASGLTALPQLEPFENIVSVIRGHVTLGITPQWVY